MSNSTLNPKVTVILIKGFATDSFANFHGKTPGIDLINNYLNDTYKDNSNIEYVSKTYQWDQKSKVLQDIEDLSLTSQDKLIIIGHSFGGDTSVDVANDLSKTNQSKKNVDLLVQIDSVGYGDDRVLNNVDRRVNYYQEGDNPAFRDVARNIESADADINVETLLKKELTHGEIDDDPLLGGLIKDEIDATIDEDKPKPKYDEEQIEKIKAEKIQYYCFTAQTPILMSDGTYKPIEKVKIGDEVMAFKGLGKLQPRKVIQTFITPNQEVVQLGDIKVTLGHHFLQPDGSFKALGEIDQNVFLVGVKGKLIPHPGIKPVAGKHTVYNFAVEDLHTYVAGNFRVHNESLSLYQPVSMGGLIGASLGGQIASLYADDKFANQLIAQSLGETVGGYVIDTINYELDPDFYTGDSLSFAALYKRLPASAIQTGIGLGSGELSESIIEAFKIEDPLAQIGVSTLTNAAVNYAVSEVIVNSLVDSFGVQKGTEYALTYFGISTDTSTAILNPDVSSVDIISTNIVNIGSSALGSYLGSELYSKLVYQWNVLSEDYSPDGAAIGATIGGIIGTYAIPIPVVGTAIGSLIGSIIGGIFGDKDYPRAGYNVSVVNGAFVNKFAYELDKGNASFASEMSNNAKELLNYFSVLVGGKLLSSELIAYGHLVGEYIYYPHSRSPGYFGGSKGIGRVGFNNAQSAIIEGVIYQLTTTRFEGGDLYLKRALKNIQLHGNTRPVSVNTVDKLIDVFQVAQEYGIYKDNPYLYEKTIQYYVDNGIETERVNNWNRIKAQAQVLNLDVKQASDTYISGNVSKIVSANSLSLPSQIISRNLPKSNYRAISSTGGRNPDHAFDGDYNSNWNSGYYARKWIEVDLGRVYDIDSIKLITEQTPSGRTIHEIRVSNQSIGNSVNGASLIKRLDSHTYNGQIINLNFAGQKIGRYVQIKTVYSPSWIAWREIEVVGTPVASNGQSVISGSVGNDVLIARISGQALDGDKGDDIYVYSRGKGTITIFDSGGLDTIEFDGSVKDKSDLLVEQQGDNLVIAIKDPNNPSADFSSLTDKIIIENFSSNRIEHIRLGNNQVITINSSGSLVSQSNQSIYSYNSFDVDNPFEIKASFDPPVYGVQNNNFHFKSGDFNGDGKTDLVHFVDDHWRANYNGYVNVWISKGDGTFDIKRLGFDPDNYGVNNNNFKYETGDFNGDGKTDLVHFVDDSWKSGNGYIHVWFSKGDGTFDISYFDPANYGVNNNNFKYETGDFNGDGKTDLVHFVDDSWRGGNGYIHVWFSKGDGTFDISYFDPANYGVNNNNFKYETGDFNGDGKTDLAHFVDDSWKGGNGKVNIWLSNEDGTFNIQPSFDPPVYGVQNNNFHFKSGDFNGDGKTDLVHFVDDHWRANYNGYVNVWISKGDGTFDIKRLGFDPDNYGVNNNNYRYEAGDFNGDGKTDLVHFVDDSWKGGNGYIHVWMAGEYGTFDSEFHSLEHNPYPVKKITINDNNNLEILEFTENITPENLPLTRQNNHLLITLNNQTITLQNQFTPENQIEIFRFADGSEYTPLLTTTNTVTLQPLLGKSEYSPDNTQLSPNFTLSPHKLAVVDVTGDGIRLIPANDSLTQYDIDNDSYPEQMGWVAPTDGFLVRDVNKDGDITTLNEFFSLTPQNNVTHLATLDSNGDNLINADDIHFHDLRIWRDANLNATVELGELTALWRYGINSLSILPQAKDYTVAGNKITASAYLTRVGVETRTTAKLYDVQFAHNPNGVKLESLGNGFAQFNYENKRNILFAEQDNQNLTLTIDAEQVYSVTGSTGNDVLNILDKNNLGVVINGGDRNDILIGGEGSDRIFANGGDDIITIDGWDNLAHIDGGEGTDILIIEGDDPVSLSLSDLNVEIVTGNDQNNLFTYDGTSPLVMEGGKGNDTMRGGSNDDILNGGDGNDILMGGGGRNTLTGGHGADIYQIFTSNSPDIITDFDVTEDKIQLQGKQEDYYLGNISENLSQGTGIFTHNNELIGIITGVLNLSLEQSAFSFVWDCF